jgi:ribosomal protein S18 acetylase RimI-like enzyme
MTVTLRLESSADEAFLRHLIVETVAEEWGAVAWPEPMRSHLLEVQYAARRQSRRVDFPDATGRVIQADEESAGWVVTASLPHEMHIVDIMILPKMRGRGIGTAAIQTVLSTAAHAGKPVRLSVNRMNRGATRLYERLGFRKIGEDEGQYFMERDLTTITPRRRR